MNPSAFEQDDAKRKQQEIEDRLAKSIGITDDQGRELHGAERTEAARNLREEMKAAASDTRRGLDVETKEARADERMARRRGDTVRVVINAPHKAVVRGNQIAITIAPQAADGGGSDAGAGPNTPLKLINASVPGKLRVVYGTINGAAATGMSLGDVPPFEFTPSGTAGVVYAVLTLAADFGGFTSFTISSSGSVPANTTSTIYFQIGSYGTTGGLFIPAAALAGSLTADICGSATSDVPNVTFSSV